MVLAVDGGAQAAGPVRRPVLAELFTSEGCSSCPPADALLGEIARSRPDVLVLAFHVTYWDNLGWADPYALRAATARQERYGAALGLDAIYTPQLVVDGTRDVVGSDRDGVEQALRAAAASDPAVPLSIARTASGVTVAAGAGAGHGGLLLVGFDPEHRTKVARGENAGRTLTEANVVRGIRPVAAWSGAALSVTAAPPPGSSLAAILQADDGKVLGVATLE
jgi:hypothetical protein